MGCLLPCAFGHYLDWPYSLFPVKSDYFSQGQIDWSVYALSVSHRKGIWHYAHEWNMLTVEALCIAINQLFLDIVGKLWVYMKDTPIWHKNADTHIFITISNISNTLVFLMEYWTIIWYKWTIRYRSHLNWTSTYSAESKKKPVKNYKNSSADITQERTLFLR